jgi:hypothetical protein
MYTLNAQARADEAHMQASVEVDQFLMVHTTPYSGLLDRTAEPHHVTSSQLLLV